MRHTLQKFYTRLMALALAVLLVLCAVPAVSAEDAGGSCGSGLTWSLSGDTLVISGSGAMNDYSENKMAPWYAYRAEISTVQLPKGLTRVGDLAFYGCEKLQTVILPSSVTEIGWYAFAGCTGMTMLDLGGAVQTIEEGAFKECTSLTSIRLPGTLKTIGYQAFYRCEALTQITVPSSVTSLGMSAFAFCYELITADIQAPLTTLPDWTFYGCSRLTSLTLPGTMTGANEYAFYDCTSLSGVTCSGSEANLAQIQADIQRDLDTTERQVNVKAETNEEPEEAEDYDESHVSVEMNDDSTVLNEKTTTQTDKSSIITEITTNYPTDGGEKTSEAKVTVTLESDKDDDWDEVTERIAAAAETPDTTVVDVYLKEGSELPGKTLNALAGKNVTLAVHTSDGAVWKFDCAALGQVNERDSFDLSYERTDATEEQLALMGCTVGYQVTFSASAEINAEVMIKLPNENARQNATMYQPESHDMLTTIQSVVVDYDGYGHFYLGSVDRRTTYLIGINVPGAEAEAIIPAELFADYGVSDTLDDTEYVVTGRTSSWGMDIKQVTWIMIAVLVVSVLVVGFVMFALNRRKLKKGYVPDLAEEDFR